MNRFTYNRSLDPSQVQPSRCAMGRRAAKRINVYCWDLYHTHFNCTVKCAEPECRSPPATAPGRAPSICTRASVSARSVPAEGERRGRKARNPLQTPWPLSDTLRSPARSVVGAGHQKHGVLLRGSVWCPGFPPPLSTSLPCHPRQEEGRTPLLSLRRGRFCPFQTSYDGRVVRPGPSQINRASMQEEYLLSVPKLT